MAQHVGAKNCACAELRFTASVKLLEVARGAIGEPRSRFNIFMEAHRRLTPTATHGQPLQAGRSAAPGIMD